MKRIDRIIEDIRDINKNSKAWIYNKDGSISDEVICGDVIPFLEELKEYEVDCTDEEIEQIVENSDSAWNTYNWNDNISHDIDINQKCIDDCYYMAIKVHRYGDIRANYTDTFLVKFDDEFEIFGLYSTLQYVPINDRYGADVDIFSECYTVYDNEKDEEVGEFYEMEKKELLKELTKEK